MATFPSARFAIALLLALFSSVASAAEKAEAPVVKDFAVHEWGVFRVHNDVELANADMRAIWEGLPKFVYGQVSARRLPQHWKNAEAVDRPVLFFHAPQAMAVELRIDFPTGIPAVWWPGTEAPAWRNGELVGGENGKKVFKYLQWRLHLKDAPFKELREVGLKPVDDGHWVKTLRAVAADDVFARVGEERFGYEREKFVYYDGLLPRGDWVQIKIEKDKANVTSRAEHPVYDLTVVDRRTPDRIRVARLAKLDGKAKDTALKFEEIDAEAWPAVSKKALTSQLTTAGLNADEAGSLVTLWDEELFQTEGVTLYYRLPQEEYERLLPLKLTPRPEKCVRVGLVVHPHCEPDLAERVAGLVADLEAKEFIKRGQAQERLEKLGRAAAGHLFRLREQTKDPELRRRLDHLLEKYEVAKALAP